jgi:hypothetical protein
LAVYTAVDILFDAVGNPEQFRKLCTRVSEVTNSLVTKKALAEVFVSDSRCTDAISTEMISGISGIYRGKPLLAPSSM